MKKIWSGAIVGVLLAASVGTAAFGMASTDKQAADGKEQRYAWPLATCSTEDTITHVFAE